MQFVLDAIIMVTAATILLRISGRKSIAQMTIAQTVVMISVGSIIAQPIVEKSVWRTVIAVAIFITFLLVVEYIKMKFNRVETILSGKAKVVIQNGKIIEENMRKLRFTVDQLEQQLRIQGISRIEDVKTATLEANGQIGYELAQHAKPVTYGEMVQLLKNLNISVQTDTNQSRSIFEEVALGTHQQKNPKELH